MDPILLAILYWDQDLTLEVIELVMPEKPAEVEQPKEGEEPVEEEGTPPAEGGEKPPEKEGEKPPQCSPPVPIE